MRNLELKEIPTHKAAIVFTEETMIMAIKDSYGIISRVARNLEVMNKGKCDFYLARKNIQYYQSTIDMFQQEKEGIIDKSIDTLMKGLRDGDQNTAKWLLRILDKKHFSEELTINGGDLKFNIVLPEGLTEEEQAEATEILKQNKK
jgi:hypothetical protein